MADFQKHLSDLEQENIKLIAGSIDSEDQAGRTVDKLELTFPVACNLEFATITKTLGCFYEPEKKFFHATGFLLKPDSRIEVACYSSGAIGRLRAENVLSLVRYYKEHRD